MPSKPFAPSANQNAIGFTLIEIMLAIFIFAIVLATIFGSYRTVFNRAERLSADSRLFEMAENCLNRLVQDLQSVQVSMVPGYAPPGMNDPADPYRFFDETVSTAGSAFPRLQFAALAHVPLEGGRENGIARITYYVQEHGDEGLVLKRSDRLYPFGSFAERGSDPILCTDLRSLAFVFFDQDKAPHEHWDSEARGFNFATPRAVSVRIEIGDARHSVQLETRVLLPVFRDKRG